MPMEEEPVVGRMYEDAEGQSFEILAFDEDDGTIEVQYEDGRLDEIDIDAWYEMDLKPLKSAAWKEPDAEAGEEDEKPKPADEDDDLDEYEDHEDEDE